MNNSGKPKTVRKTLATGFHGDLTIIGGMQSAEMDAQQLEKLHINFPNSSIAPSSLNPRRRSLDRAGVTPEAISDLAIKELESVTDWLSRVDAYINSIADTKSQQIWINLFDLAVSILEQGILQPIIVNKEHIIVAGERRWTASQLAGKQFSRVIVRVFTSVEEAVFRLAENLRRSDLSVAETVSGLRAVIAVSLGACVPDNEKITIDAVSALTGAGRTTAAYYRAFCRLPEDDDILNAINNDEYTNIKLAYADAAERVRLLLAGDEAPAADDKTADGADELSKAEPKAKSVEVAQAKLKVPMRPSLSRLIDVFATLEGLPEAVASELAYMSKQWNDVDDKEKAKILAAAMSMAVEFLEANQVAVEPLETTQ